MNSEKLTHSQIISGLTKCFNELIAADISKKETAELINKSKAVAAVVTAYHREEIMDTKRDQVKKLVTSKEDKELQALKTASEKDKP